jgi:hypothetical protein
LPQSPWFTFSGKTDNLHAQGAATTDYPASFDVLYRSPGQGPGIEAGMRKEAPVFKNDDGRLKLLGNGIHGGETPLAIFGNPGSEELAIPVFYYG